MQQDFNIQVTVRNARLLRAIRESHDSPAEFARFAGISQTGLSALMTMRARPFKSDGSLTAIAEAIVSALGVPPDDLWPDHIARLKARKARIEIEMYAPAFAEISDQSQEQSTIYRLAISKWSQCLSDREKSIVSKRNSGYTLEEVAQEFGVTRERIKQIAVKAERKMRGEARKDGVKVFSDLQ